MGIVSVCVEMSERCCHGYQPSIGNSNVELRASKYLSKLNYNYAEDVRIIAYWIYLLSSNGLSAV